MFITGCMVVKSELRFVCWDCRDHPKIPKNWKQVHGSRLGWFAADDRCDSIDQAHAWVGPYRTKDEAIEKLTVLSLQLQLPFPKN